MDINFHYYAVKTIAIFAGFNEPDAQLIASYSQFVDDYDVWRNFTFKTIPENCNFEELVKKNTDNTYDFYTVTTGFNSCADNARLCLDKYQKEVVLPFHFIPWKPYNDITNRADFRTRPESIEDLNKDISDKSLIIKLLENAKAEFEKANTDNDNDKRRYSLIQIGVLLHIYADTYAHNNFSGLHGWENYSYIETALDNKKKEYMDISKIYSMVYSIGHTNVGHIPDMTNVTFSMRYALNEGEKSKEQYSGFYRRDNTFEFCNAADQIFIYLRGLCRTNDNSSLDDEIKQLNDKLKQGFMLTDEKKYSNDWKTITNINYCYSKEKLYDEQLKTIESWYSSGILTKNYDSALNDFFSFNIIAKKIRNAVIGN